MRLIDADVLKREMVDDYERNDTFYPEYHMEALRIVRSMIDAQPTVGGWISVKDRLPESGTVCLTYSPKGRMRVAKAFLPSTLPNSSYDPMECWWYLSGCGGRFVAVTHWMPLPEPPKEE
jgi:hypothetical protein